MELILIIPLLLSFFVVFFTLPGWIRRAKNAGLEGKDMNKYSKNRVAEGGGVVCVAGFVIGIFVYIAIKTFYINSGENSLEILALTSSVIILAFIGLIDDILGWKIGLGKRVRISLCLLAAIPLMVINAGHSDMTLPFIGGINITWLYPLVFIPIGIIGTSTTFNFLAGYNGLEAGQGVIIIGALSIVAFLTGSSWLALVGLCLVFALLAFLYFNRYPARVFPGNVLTYPIGGMIAIIAILGNFEKIAVVFFIPYILEVVLKARGKLKKESFAKPNRDNSLEMPYKKIYGLEHFAIWLLKKFKEGGKVYEKDVVHLIYAIQFVFVIIGFVIFRQYIF